VSTALKSRLRSLGAAADVRFLAGDQMNVLTNNEISYALKGARTALVEVDAAAPGEKKKKRGVFD